METRTIRELGGEIWAELEMNREDFKHLDVELNSAIIDITMAVLARHENKRIVNDEDFPVVPLPRRFKDEE